MKKKILIYTLSLVLVIALGVLYNYGIEKEKQNVETRKQHEQLLYEIDFDKVKENEDTNFLKEEDDTVIIRRLDAFKKDELVGIIYVGETTGRKEGLQVAFGINTKTDAIVGMVIMESNETPEYQAKLTENEKFLNQFHNKDMAGKSFKVEATSGASQTGGGINKIMQLVRAQYDNDTEFESPVGLELVSQYQNDYETLNFTYEFKNADEEIITVITDQNYKIINISNDDYKDDAVVAINDNKFENYISEINDNTITIITKGYTGQLVFTATVVDGVITNFDGDISSESYDSSYNDLYTGGNVEGLLDQIVAGEELEAVTGATITSTAIISARDILVAYLEEVNA